MLSAFFVSVIFNELQRQTKVNMTHPMSEPWLDWKPIATAPRDPSGQTWVLLYSDKSPEPYDVARWSYDGECWLTAGGEFWAEDEPCGPTLWASIPTPNPELTIG